MTHLTDTRPATPAQVEGPFYPVGYKYHEGNNLRKGPNGLARGEAIIIAGTLGNTQGHPLSHVLVEIWQADNNGHYDHPGDHKHPAPLDQHFQYWGKTVTDELGRYFFETIKPAAYNDQGDWRTPHIHFKLYLKRHICALTTQMYFEGETLNEQDNHLSALPKEKQRLLLTKPEKLGKKYGFGPDTSIYEFDITL